MSAHEPQLNRLLPRSDVEERADETDGRLTAMAYADEMGVIGLRLDLPQ